MINNKYEYYQYVTCVYVELPAHRAEDGDSSTDNRSLPSRMLKKTASIVLASLRGSTYRRVRLASSLAAALQDGLFEHPVAVEAPMPCEMLLQYFSRTLSFSAAC